MLDIKVTEMRCTIARLFVLTFVFAVVFAANIAQAEPPSAQVSVFNRGYSGANSRDLLRLLPDALKLNPDLLILMVGTNDMLNSGNSVPLEEYKENLSKIATIARRAGAQVILMTIPPCHEPFLYERHPKEFYKDDAPQNRIKKANEVVKDAAREHNLTVVDVNRLFTALSAPYDVAESLLRNPENANGKKDGVHPTSAGYSIIAAAVFQAVSTLSEPPQRILCYGDSITFGCGVPGEGTADGETYPGCLGRLLRENPSSL